MRRREFITLLGGTAAAWPLAARAQQAGKLPTIGLLIPATRAAHGPWFASLVQRLNELGWIEDRTVTIEHRYAEGRSDRYDEIAAEFVRLKVDVIVAVAASFRVALLDRDGATLDPTEFVQSLYQRGEPWAVRCRRGWGKQADGR